MPKQSTYSTFTPILSDYLSATDDPGGTPVHGNVTLTSLRDLLQANLTKATITAAANAEALVSTGYSLTGSNAQSLVDLSGTWNTTGTPTAIKLNVTDTASNAASKLLDLQVGGSTKADVVKTGIFRGTLIGSSTPTFGLLNGQAGVGFYSTNRVSIIADNSIAMFFGNSQNTIPNGRPLGFEAGAVALPDVLLYRDAPNTLALRNGANAQAFNVYNTYTDASNYERGYAKWTSNVFEISIEKGGTGSNRALALANDNGSLFIRQGFVNIMSCGASAGTLNYIESMTMNEKASAPTAVANKAILYAEDDGSGKTRLMVRFGTGASQQIAIEP